MAKVRLFGSIHFNTRSIVEDDLRAFAEGADAIAIEGVDRKSSFRSVLGLVLRYPFFFVGVMLQFALVQIPLVALFNRELRATEQLAAREVSGNRPVHTVDRPLLSVLADRSAWWIVADWLVFLLLAVLFPVQLAFAVGIAVGLSAIRSLHDSVPALLLAVAGVVLGLLGWVLLFAMPFVNDIIGYVPLLALFLGGTVCINLTLEQRNEVMLERLEELAEEHGYDRICLTTGYSHLPGMVELASSYGLEVVDVYRPSWRESGEVVDPETVLESESTEPTVERYGLETAGDVLGRRAAAIAIDWLVIAGIAFLQLFALVIIDMAASFAAESTMQLLVVLGWLLTPPVYFSVCEARYSRTVGKTVTGLVVVRLDGTPCSTTDAVVRALVHPIDFLPIGYVVGAIVAAVTDDGRRLGDLAAGTTVVKSTDVDHTPVDDSRPADSEPSEALPRVPTLSDDGADAGDPDRTLEDRL